MSISCLTWASDSHGLFDYESRNVFKKNFKVQCLQDSYRAIRIKTDVLLLPEEEAIQFLHQQREFPASDVRSLLKLQWTNGAYHVIPSHSSEVCIDPASHAGVHGAASHARSSNSSGALPSHVAAGQCPGSPLNRPTGGPSPRASSQGRHSGPAATLAFPSVSVPDSDRSPGGEANLPAADRCDALSRGQSLFPPENAHHTSRGGTAGGAGAAPLPNASHVVSPNPSPPSSLAPGTGTAEPPVSSLAGSGSGRLPEAEEPASSRAPSVDDPVQAGNVSNDGGSVSSARGTGFEARAPADSEALSPRRNPPSGTAPRFEGDTDSQNLEPAHGPALVSLGGTPSSPVDEGENGAGLRASGSPRHASPPPSAGFSGGPVAPEADPSLAAVTGSDVPRISAEKIWLVVRSLRERGGVTLREGDVMKLGRFRLKVKELVANYQQAARAQEHRLPAADADECETVAPEPENQNAGHSAASGEPEAPVPSPGGLGLAYDQVEHGPGGGSLQSHNDSSSPPEIRVPYASPPLDPLSLPGDRVSVLSAPSPTSPAATGDSGDRDQESGSEVREREREERLRVEGALDAEFLPPQSQTGPMPPTAAATDDEDVCGIERPRRNEGPRQASSFALPDGSVQDSHCSSLAPPAPPTPRQFSEGLRNSYGCFPPQRPACRICLCEAPDEDDAESRNNPLVAPCRCKEYGSPNADLDAGSMKHVHLQCLRTWMEGRLNIRSDGTTVGYFLRALDCELCKAPYPAFVDGGRGRVIELFEIPRPSFPYIILEPRSSHPSPSSPSPPALRRGLHVVSLATRRTARLGRGHESDIRLSDISVSRLHALIKFSQGAFWLEDQRSKFGTLVELKRPLKLERGGTGVALQVGRTVISIVVKRQWSFPLPVCLKGVRAPESDITVLECPQQASASSAPGHGPSIPPALTSPRHASGYAGPATASPEAPAGASRPFPVLPQMPQVAPAPQSLPSGPLGPSVRPPGPAELPGAASQNASPQSRPEAFGPSQVVVSPRSTLGGAARRAERQDLSLEAPGAQEAAAAPGGGEGVGQVDSGAVGAHTGTVRGAACLPQERQGGGAEPPRAGVSEREEAGEGEGAQGRSRQEAEGGGAAAGEASVERREREERVENEIDQAEGKEEGKEETAKAASGTVKREDEA
ncbi:forkhead-associated domain-containing protein, related [Neospora caninum Liverpool]|uniref:Forkhead-associated domain-containing protein, related n=1 Tax=Neospora caninum (strain Liverpool) TaxID=572307 RepID=F0VBK6_NEOCL|nr:forkhead-associated domain-containing protein, related [Neospora caninum Liverpool]CBZ50990.1 forkhead-associated domain-containing protein, related [Neospora caninum Liverpool]CEL68293.1 TPA: Forkhead-associated domain-containing protein, related [Neospora caninum Liverpool]|eukprot:XP_003881023.1 forkhead-associated domain-containing protein, related [Neospora caninum Liverpool]